MPFLPDALALITLSNAAAYSSLYLSLPGHPQEKILAAVVSLLERTNIRVGNSFYEKLYGSFGLTTLKNRHVKISGSQIRFTFKGKKGVLLKAASLPAL